ncbi:hypothetical protein WA026_013359 [Henosepilachna vigintioctopunctata]|uniref:Acyltransferase 3 domain-containing protein n=1 Tax=Henosepilachna vigintioctopunctata TaxID=420089 RepID=A0AAW1V5Q9_9CUCU
MNEEQRKQKTGALRNKLSGQQNILEKQGCSQKLAAHASYVVAYNIARNNISVSDGDFVKTCMLHVSDVLCPKKQSILGHLYLTLVVWCYLLKNCVVMSLLPEENKLYETENEDGKLFQYKYRLPKLYQIDQTETCPENHYYCKMNIKLHPSNPENTSLMWKAIEKINTDNEVKYRRDIIYRAFCVGFNDSRLQYQEYSSQGVDGSVLDSYCVKEKKLFDLMDKIDICFLAFLIFYCGLVIYSTFKSYSKTTSSAENDYIQLFSIKSTWNDLQRPNRKEDFNNLLFIQGLRTLLAIYVVWGHNFFLVMLSFSHNPEYLENFFVDPFRRVFTGSLGLSIQIFFVISSWLHALSLYNLERNKASFTIKDVLIITLNRYFRLMPLIIINVLVQKSGISNYILEPLHQSHYTEEIARCESGWLKNLLLIQNLPIFGGHSCMIHSWYVAADTQLFVLSTMAFYISRKFKISLRYFGAVAIGATVGIQTFTMLTSDYGLFRFLPRDLPFENLFIRPGFLIKYFSTVNHASTYAIGFCFGILYAEYKRKNIFDTFVKKLFWFNAFFVLPIVTCILYSHNYSMPLEFFMAVTLRPLFHLE